MQLVRRDFRNQDVPSKRLAEIREVGGRLEYMVSRYERLVRDMLRDSAPEGELQSRLRLLNREIGLLALSLQDLMVARREALPGYDTVGRTERTGVVVSA
ncbi:MAG: hypothetical protein KBA95_15465 [Acidobacteria bacterium]|nr:hypothetical protein [Acidobacteriota bacterium]